MAPLGGLLKHLESLLRRLFKVGPSKVAHPHTLAGWGSLWRELLVRPDEQPLVPVAHRAWRSARYVLGDERPLGTMHSHTMQNSMIFLHCPREAVGRCQQHWLCLDDCRSSFRGVHEVVRRKRRRARRSPAPCPQRALVPAILSAQDSVRLLFKFLHRIPVEEVLAIAPTYRY